MGRLGDARLAQFLRDRVRIFSLSIFLGFGLTTACSDDETEEPVKADGVGEEGSALPEGIEDPTLDEGSALPTPSEGADASTPPDLTASTLPPPAAAAPTPPPAPVATPAATPTGTGVYPIQSGDTLGTIAQKIYGSRAKWQDIASANNLKAPFRIYAGKELSYPINDAKSQQFAQKLSGAAMKTVTVKSGDTLSSLAGKLLGNPGAWNVFVTYNKDKITNPNRIEKGMVLKYADIKGVVGTGVVWKPKKNTQNTAKKVETPKAAPTQTVQKPVQKEVQPTQATPTPATPAQAQPAQTVQKAAPASKPATTAPAVKPQPAAPQLPDNVEALPTTDILDDDME